MRSFGYIVLLLITSLFAQDALSQAQQRRTPQQRRQAQAEKESGLPSLTVRAASKNEDQTRNLENKTWVREIYRMLDLTKEKNSPLYFPEHPIGERMNLFTLAFKLIAQGKMTAYNYLDGREIFTDEYKVNFEDVLKRSQILYTTEGTGDQAQYMVEDVDIPSNEVTLYMIKEAWYFDQATGMFNSQVIAICPMLVRQEDDFGEPTRTPLFWVPYENIRPYVSRSLIMTSNINNAMTYTIDDYFSKRMYDGEIIKTTNMMNQSLAQQVGNVPENLKRAQDSIETQLTFFEKKLWIEPDTIQTISNSKKKEKSTRSTRGNDEPKAQKEAKTKTEKSSSAPTKSVRRR